LRALWVSWVSRGLKKQASAEAATVHGSKGMGHPQVVMRVEWRIDAATVSQ